MINQPKEHLPFSKSPAEKSLPVDQSPVFDPAEDLNNEDFVNANDPERKFIPINEVEDKDSDFTEKMDDKEEVDDEPSDEHKLDEAWQAMQEDSGKEELAQVRKDIGHYTYKGPDNVALASFHVDHDNEEMIGVVEEGLESFRPTDPETIQDAPLEEEFADINVTRDKKISAGVFPEGVRRYRDNRNSNENLKTMPDSKIQKNNRGLIRKFLDNVWNKN
jgi:hypothetical protein